jgi:GNAT superfamily N-acetyltransferase
MALTAELRAFWETVNGMSLVVDPQPWGAVATDARFPLVWDANHASVFVAPGPSLHDVRSALLPALRAAGAGYEHVECWDLPADDPLVAELRKDHGTEGADVVMVHEGDEARTPMPPSEAEVHEVDANDDEFWAWYGGTRNSFGGVMTGEVIAQLVRRDREVIATHGARWFVGHLDGRRAGLTSLHHLAGVDYADNVVTLEPFRRRGVAAAMIDAATRASRESGTEVLHLLAEEGGAPSRMYERLGFRVHHRVVSFTRRLDATPGAAPDAAPGGRTNA